jgi:hypothetical protein
MKMRDSKFQIGIAAALLTFHVSRFTLAASYNATPKTLAAVVAASAIGDTITLNGAPLVLTTNPNGPALTLPTGRHYMGNGTTVSLSGGLGDGNYHQELISFAGSGNVTEVTGFVFTDAQIHCEGGIFNIHDNTFTNGQRGIFVANNSGHFDSNIFSQLASEAIYGYPGPNCTYNLNSIDQTGNDGIHLFATGTIDGVSVSGNRITNCHRIGIEAQNALTNLMVANNYVSILQPPAPASFMALSLATGNGKTIAISGNTLVSNRDAGAAIEIMGTGVTIQANDSWNFSQFILNGSQGPVTSNGNQVFGGIFAANDSDPWAIGAIISTADQIGPLAGNPPAVPATPGAVVIPAAAAAVATPATAPATLPSPITLISNDGGKTFVRQ